MDKPLNHFDIVLRALVKEPGFRVSVTIEDNKWVYYLHYIGEKQIGKIKRNRFKGLDINCREEQAENFAEIMKLMVQEVRRVLLQKDTMEEVTDIMEEIIL
jgi:hypothetical protein